MNNNQPQVIEQVNNLMNREEICYKAVIIKKRNRLYYLLKHGNKDSFMCGGQSRLDDDFMRKFYKKDVRDSNWTAIARGNLVNRPFWGLTSWSCPTSEVYGRIRVGNRKNMALYFVKAKLKNFYSDFSRYQRSQIQPLLDNLDAELNNNEVNMEKCQIVIYSKTSKEVVQSFITSNARCLNGIAMRIDRDEYDYTVRPIEPIINEGDIIIDRN